jgi:hypothetical protein
VASTFDFAQQYAAAGLSVIPCLPRDKKPAIPWQQYQERRATASELSAWFGNGKAHNLAIVTGAVSGVLVLDVDGSEGLASIADKSLPPTPCVKTAKGYHYYYRHPGFPVRNFARRLPGLDLRGDGGYVLAPGSVHPSGALYEWALPLDTGMADVPAWLLALLERPQAPAPDTKSGWLARTLRGVGEGQRNDAAIKLAGRYRRAGWDTEAILEALRCWNLRNLPPMGDAELVQVCKSASGMTGPRDLRRQTATELLAKQFEPQRWIVPDMLPAGSLAVIASKAKLGKTWLMLQLATAVATGGQFLGRKVDAGKVVYLALEDGERLVQARLRLQSAPSSMDSLVFYDGILPLNTPEGMAQLTDLLETERPNLLIVDTISAAKTGKLDENLAGDFADLANPLRTLAHDMEVTILLVHHHGKLSTGDAVMDLRGSTALAGAVDAIMALYRERGQPRAKLSIVGRNVIDTSLALDFDSDITHTWQCVGDAKEVAMSEAEQEVTDALARMGEPVDAGSIAEELGKTRIPVRVVCERLADAGIIARHTTKGQHNTKHVLYSCKEREKNYTGEHTGIGVSGQTDRQLDTLDTLDTPIGLSSVSSVSAVSQAGPDSLIQASQTRVSDTPLARQCTENYADAVGRGHFDEGRAIAEVLVTTRVEPTGRWMLYTGEALAAAKDANPVRCAQAVERLRGVLEALA